MVTLPLVAIRPPEFAPRLETAALLLQADRVVLADTFAFSRQSYHNRARILTSQGPRWLTVPRRHAGLGQPIQEVEVVDDGWRRRHREALRAAYGAAPYYEHIAPEWEQVLETQGSLGDLAVATVEWAARWLQAPAEILRASTLPGAPRSLGPLAESAGAVLSIPESAARDAEALPETPVRLLHLDRQRLAPGVAGLSILDLLMRHGPAAAQLLRAMTTVAEGKSESHVDAGLNGGTVKP